MKKNIQQIMQELHLSESQVKEILLGRKQKKSRVLKTAMTDEVIRFGVVGDTHMCSREERINELQSFYEICHKMGIKTILHAGDILDGWGVYRGQQAEVHTFGAKGQAQYVIDHYPKVEGIVTRFITGNHDESWWKLAGIDVGDLITAQRSDMDYLGMYMADVKIGSITIRLHHGDGGGAYALSYKGQKFAEQIPSGNKPHVLLLGHYHTAFYFWYRRIHILNVGCFQGQTNFLKRKMLNPAIGGWMVEMRISKDGKNVIAFKPAWIPFS
jgi:predicted phosphodiesterase